MRAQAQGVFDWPVPYVLGQAQAIVEDRVRSICSESIAGPDFLSSKTGGFTSVQTRGQTDAGTGPDTGSHRFALVSSTPVNAHCRSAR